MAFDRATDLNGTVIVHLPVRIVRALKNWLNTCTINAVTRGIIQQVTKLPRKWDHSKGYVEVRDALGKVMAKAFHHVKKEKTDEFEKLPKRCKEDLSEYVIEMRRAREMSEDDVGGGVEENDIGKEDDYEGNDEVDNSVGDDAEEDKSEEHEGDENGGEVNAGGGGQGEENGRGEDKDKEDKGKEHDTREENSGGNEGENQRGKLEEKDRNKGGDKDAYDMDNTLQDSRFFRDGDFLDGPADIYDTDRSLDPSDEDGNRHQFLTVHVKRLNRTLRKKPQ
jgi:hypothetical protein